MFTTKPHWQPSPIRLEIKNRWRGYRLCWTFDILWIATEFRLYSDYSRFFLPSFDVTIFNIGFTLHLEFLKREMGIAGKV